VTIALPLKFAPPGLRERDSNIATLTPAPRSPSQQQPHQVKKSA